MQLPHVKTIPFVITFLSQKVVNLTGYRNLVTSFAEKKAETQQTDGRSAFIVFSARRYCKVRMLRELCLSL